MLQKVGASSQMGAKKKEKKYRTAEPLLVIMYIDL
jgi:hypothetical protein